MALVSSATKLHNDVLQYESSSERRIPSSSYYVLKMIVGYNEDTKKMAKRESSRRFEGDGIPLTVYVFQNEIYIVFSSLDSGNHHMNGRHHALVSNFVCRYVKKCGGNVECSIVEFDSRIKVLVYFQTKIYEGAKRVISKYLGYDDLTKSVMDMSMTEAIELLQQRDPPIIWDKIAKHDRYGTFYRFEGLESKQKKYSVFSEKINSENIETFRKYLFSK
jgi:hypothetical protein